MNLVDPQHPFYRPLWRRVLIVMLCLAWGLFEFVQGSAFWGVLFAGAGVYCGWEFFFNVKPDAPAGDMADPSERASGQKADSEKVEKHS